MKTQTQRTLAPFENLHQEMERLFHHGVGRRGSNPARSFAYDIAETQESYLVQVDVPGFKLEELGISVVDNELRLTGKRVQPETADEVVWHRQDRRQAELSENIRFPVDIDVEKVAADVGDGVLSISLPKTAKAMPRKIDLSRRS